MSERSRPDDETQRWTARLRPDTLGEAFGALFAVSFGSFYLSLLGVAVYGLVFDELADLPLVVAAGSWVGIVVSALGYSIWSVRELRRMSRDQDGYNERLRKTIWMFVFLGIVAFLVPLGILFGEPRGSGG